MGAVSKGYTVSRHKLVSFVSLSALYAQSQRFPSLQREGMTFSLLCDLRVLPPSRLE